ISASPPQTPAKTSKPKFNFGTSEIHASHNSRVFFVQVKSRRASREAKICGRLQAADALIGFSAQFARIGFRGKHSATIVLLLLLSFGPRSAAANWQSTLTKAPPGDFPELRPLRATYRFGWSGLTAATGEVHFTKTSEGRFQLDGTG